jgi:hypothetical protein
MISGSDTDRFQPTLVRVDLACEVRHEHESSKLGESESGLSRIVQYEIYCPIAVDLIYNLLSESYFDGE